MIDTDKMKAAFAATPLCQHNWTHRDGNSATPTKLCAISALVSFAGVQPDLIQTMQDRETEGAVAAMTVMGAAFAPRWVADLALPVLQAVYGIPREVGAMFPSIFDAQENEWKGVTEVLAMCETHNMTERHADAIREDAARFPQHGPTKAPAFITGFMGISKFGDSMLALSNVTMQLTAPTKTPTALPAKMKLGQSKFWTASKAPPIAKKLVTL
jgi:hypothetical protein